MKKVSSLLLAFSLLIFTLGVFPNETAYAAIADGTYNVPFEIKENGSQNTSIADGYFQKPAKLIVENGTQNVEFTITSSEWVKSLSGPFGQETVINEDTANNTRTVRLQINDASQPVTLEMHVVVPEDIAGMHYDQNHTVQAVFDVSGIESEQTAPPAQNNDTEQPTEPVENPQTSDDTPIALYIALLVGSVAVFVVYRLRVARSE